MLSKILSVSFIVIAGAVFFDRLPTVLAQEHLRLNVASLLSSLSNGLREQTNTQNAKRVQPLLSLADSLTTIIDSSGLEVQVGKQGINLAHGTVGPDSSSNPSIGVSPDIPNNDSMSLIEHVQSHNFVKARDCRQRRTYYIGTEVSARFNKKPKNPRSCQSLCKISQTCNFFVYVKRGDKDPNLRNKRCIFLSNVTAVEQSDSTRISGPDSCDRLFEGDVDVNEQKCFTSSGPNPGSLCQFPFEFDGRIFKGCTLYGADDGLHWCSTKVDLAGKHVVGNWGHCPLRRCNVDESGSPARTTTISVPTTTTMRTTTTSTTTTIATTTPKEHLFGSDCGINDGVFQTRIVGGSVADRSKYKWLVALMRQTGSGPRQFCGGSLITNRHVLTAAHCIVQFRLVDVYVRMGEFDLAEVSGNEVDIKLHNWHIHEQYDRRTQDNDIALLTLFEPIRFTNSIRYTCLPRPNFNYEDTHASVAGWGKIYFGGPISTILLEAEVRIWETRHCAASYQDFNRSVTKNMLCASEQGRDSCQGDSGGPLNCYNVDTKRYELCGLVSWGLRCNEPKYPGVYTRVANYIPWIESKVKI